MISHYEDGDQGSWHLYAKGAPLSLDFSSQYGPMNWRPWLHNRISIDHKTDPMILSEHDVDEFITTGLADFVSGRSVIDRLRAMSETPYETLPDGSSAGPEEKIPPVTWRRSVIFVKDSDLLGPNYFLIRDRLDSATRPADWSCWCLAESVRFDGRTARFQGQYRVDLDVVRIEPAAAAWVQDRSPVPPPPTVAKLSYGPGVAGWPEACRNPPDAHPPVLSHDFTYLRPFWQKQNPGKPFEERQLCARIRLPAGQGCLMLLYPRRREGEEIPAVAPWAGGGAALSFRNARHFVLSMPGDAEVRADGVRAHAAAFAVRQSPSGISLALLRGTRLSYQGLEIEGVGPVCLEVAGRRVRGEISGAARSVQFQLPRELSAGTSLKVDGQTRGRVARGGFTIDVPAGEHTFEVVNESP
jgi:hypothetical protein